MTAISLRRALTTLFAATLAIGALTLPAAPAHAAARDGVCDAGEVCFYHNSNQQGALSDFTESVANYGNKQPSCYVFKGRGAGSGRCIKNDVASVTNRTNDDVTVYYNSNYTGPYQVIRPGQSVNLNSTLKNQNASHVIGNKPTTPAPPPTNGSLKNPHPGRWGSNGGYTPRASWLKNRIYQEFGMTCTTYKSGSGSHATGNGLDCWGTPQKMRTLSDWLKKHARPLEVWYVIYDRKIFSLTRPASGWTPYRQSDPHTDHVHISVQDPSHEFG